jgi:zinc protease
VEIPFEARRLANGLSVVVHSDPSDPVVAVYVYYHVGSAREEPHRTGLAHLFEHMLFQGSQHVPEGEHFRRVQEAGGTLNGTTNEDRTNYYETLPSDCLELALWLESDRMGFLLPALTQATLDNQRDVVKNERRQRYDDRPYGGVNERVRAALYDAAHPLSWLTIGSMEHLDAASLDDVRAFFARWYGPGNATLAIGGDVEPERAFALAERWFGELAGPPPVPAVVPRPAALGESVRLVEEDRVEVPQLTLAWPTVPAWHADEPALNLLSEVLSANRASVLDRVLLVEEELASAVVISHGALEVHGQMTIHLRPRPGVELATLERRVDALLRETLHANAYAVDPGRLARLSARREGGLARGLGTVSARTATLGHYDLFLGRPGALREDVARHAAVTVDDVERVLARYLVDRPRVVLSVVPRGRTELGA